ncbi:MAG: hypothetical protein WBN40_00585, partial [Pseudomonadales bacterium]
VMAMPALIMPSELDDQVFTRDVLTMVALTLVIVGLIVFKTNRGATRSGFIGKPSAVLLLLIYLGYYVILISGGSHAVN